MTMRAYLVVLNQLRREQAGDLSVEREDSIVRQLGEIYSALPAQKQRRVNEILRAEHCDRLAEALTFLRGAKPGLRQAVVALCEENDRLLRALQAIESSVAEALHRIDAVPPLGWKGSK
jgi:hypothetical protein